MRLIRLEIYRAFHSHTFLVSLIIGCFICASDLIIFCINIENAYLHRAWIGTDGTLNINPVFYVLLPIIACLPFGGSLYSDMKTGYDKNICVRSSRFNYALAKGIAVYLSAFISVTLPLGLNLFIAAGLYPNYIPDGFVAMSGTRFPNRMLFTELCNYHPALYSLIFICVDGLFAGAIALTSLTISKAVRSQFTAVVTPMVFYIISSTLLFPNDDNVEIGNWSILEMLNPHPMVIYIVSSTLLFPNDDDPVIGNWSIMDMVNPSPIVTTLWYQMLTVLFVVLIINIFFIWIFSRKRDVL